MALVERMVPDYCVPNTDRLSFRGLANNHHNYILQNRIFVQSPSPSPSETVKMSPTTTQTHPTTTLTNGLNKIVGNSSRSSSTLHLSSPSGGNGYHSYSPCGDGDMCEWDWNMGSLSLQNSTPTSTSTSMLEWFSPRDNIKPNTISTSTSTTSLYPLSNGHDVNGNFSHPQDESLSNKKPFHRPRNLDFFQNGFGDNEQNSDGKGIEHSHIHTHQNGNVAEGEEDVGAVREENSEEISNQNQNDDWNSKRARSSSLKTNKTPPGTPGHKKIVRFADCLGLDLVDVKLFLDEIPNVPKSAFNDLQDAIDRREEEFTQKRNKANKLDRTLLPSFHQPVEMGDFFDRVDAQKVLLENCYLLDSHQIKGCVRVKNLDFNKSVFLRFTYDEWESFGEIETTYVPGSCDGFSDRFQFNLTVDSTRTRIGCKFAFACRYECLKQEFWDNNCGRNYVFHCVPSN